MRRGAQGAMLPGCRRGRVGGTGDGAGSFVGEVRGLFQQVYEPGGNLAVSTLIAAIPIIVLFVLLAGLRVATS